MCSLRILFVVLATGSDHSSSPLQIAFVVVDYKYSLRSLPPGSSDYRMKVSEVALLFPSLVPLWCLLQILMLVLAADLDRIII